MKSKSILFFCGDGDSLVDFRGNLIKEYLQLGYEVYAVAPYIKEHNKKKLLEWNVNLRIINFQRKSLNPFSSAKSFVELCKNISSISPDTIFSYTHKPVIFGALAGYLCRVKKIVSLITGTGHIFDSYNFITKLKRFIGLTGFKLALFVSTHVIFQNKDDKKLFIDLNLCSQAKSFVVNGSGVDLDHFQIESFPEKLTFLCLARLIESKGLREYAKACEIVRKSIPEARFLLGGPADPHNDAINVKEIKEIWKDKYGIDYLGYIEDPREAIKDCSVYVLLSYNEGTPRTGLESMSMGRPIITTDVNGCRETVKHMQNGYLVPQFDHIEAANHMLSFFNDKYLIEKMGNQSRIYCSKKYDVHKVNSSILKILNQ